MRAKIKEAGRTKAGKAARSAKVARKPRADVQIGQLRAIYGADFAKGFGDDEKLSEVISGASEGRAVRKSGRARPYAARKTSRVKVSSKSSRGGVKALRKSPKKTPAVKKVLFKPATSSRAANATVGNVSRETLAAIADGMVWLAPALKGLADR